MTLDAGAMAGIDGHGAGSKMWAPDTLRNYRGFDSEPVIRGYQTVE